MLWKGQCNCIFFKKDLCDVLFSHSQWMNTFCWPRRSMGTTWNRYWPFHIIQILDLNLMNAYIAVTVSDKMFHLNRLSACSCGTSTTWRGHWPIWPTSLPSQMSGQWKTKFSSNRPSVSTARASIASNRWWEGEKAGGMEARWII